jgi:hypothetical protein
MMILDGEWLESTLIQVTVFGGRIMHRMTLGLRQSQPLTESPWPRRPIDADPFLAC